MVKINGSVISHISYKLVQPSDYVWYEYAPAQYAQRHWLIDKVFGRKVLVRAQDEGWCSSGGRYAQQHTDEDLIVYGHIISYQDGVKIATRMAMAEVYMIGNKYSIDKMFGTDEEMFNWIADIEAEAGKSLIDIK